jgi:hypothetical protein
MATATRKPTVARKAPTAKEPHGKASMIITIDAGTSSADYRVKPEPDQCDDYTVKMFRLWRVGASEPYYVGQFADGTLGCTCPAQTHIHGPSADHPHCKHIKVLRTFGMIG